MARERSGRPVSHSAVLVVVSTTSSLALSPHHLQCDVCCSLLIPNTTTRSDNVESLHRADWRWRPNNALLLQDTQRRLWSCNNRGWRKKIADEVGERGSSRPFRPTARHRNDQALGRGGKTNDRHEKGDRKAHVSGRDKAGSAEGMGVRVARSRNGRRRGRAVEFSGKGARGS